MPPGIDEAVRIQTDGGYSWLEVYVDELGDYAPVCGDMHTDFDSTAAELACQDLGYQTGWKADSYYFIFDPIAHLTCGPQIDEFGNYIEGSPVTCSVYLGSYMGTCGNPGLRPYAAAVTCSSGKQLGGFGERLPQPTRTTLPYPSMPARCMSDCTHTRS